MKSKNFFEKSRRNDRFVGKSVPFPFFLALIGIVSMAGPGATGGACQTPMDPSNRASVSRQISASDAESARAGHSNALRLVRRVIEQLALGEAFDAKVRQRVWVGGREVIGVGTYEQAGDGSGRFNLQVAMHDGDGKHTLQQISDGRLAWTREQIGDEVTLQRVDVGRLDQWVHGSSLSILPLTSDAKSETIVEAARSIVSDLPPSVRVGGFTEMLERLSSDYNLKLVSGKLEEEEVWIVRGSLRSEVRERMLVNFPGNEWPELCPTECVVAIAKSPNPETQFGQGMPVRIEFWASPAVVAPASSESNAAVVEASLVSRNSGNEVAEAATIPVPAAVPSNRLVSLIELYSIRPIASPPIGRFRFENQDMEVNFTNETDRYLTRYGIRITERQSRLLRR